LPANTAARFFAALDREARPDEAMRALMAEHAESAFDDDTVRG